MSSNAVINNCESIAVDEMNKLPRALKLNSDKHIIRMLCRMVIILVKHIKENRNYTL